MAEGRDRNPPAPLGNAPTCRRDTRRDESNGSLAHLARAPALQAGGSRFDSDKIHADVVELVYTLVSEASASGIASSTLAVSTTPVVPGHR